VSAFLGTAVSISAGK